ncbi:MAG TPA: Ni/Fe-hydrogenase cytochrome b subunit [Ignavibacteriaceae bacterium]|nr:Ni/Fe-hydrogenase cytochrome b subunit [Ignavibacteriaceae bacterium]
MNRVRNTKLILWLIAGFAAAVALNRFVFGLGVTTNLNDKTPWGLWIGFDVMAGVALAAGGFVITAIFYMLKREEFHPLVKPAVLTAFLGYLAVIFSLLVDLGLPWNIWHMIIYWNPHSPLFEVGWCVMLYTTVLLLEFSPTPLEEFSRYAKIRNFLMKFRFPFVLLGIMLSTLHQSSLGSLFLIMPFKLYPLWYTGILPIEFFISAVALGLMMVAFESLVSHWLYKRKPETNLIAKLCRVVVWVLATYFLVKIIDIISAGKFELIFNGSWQSNLFIAEVLISTVIPAVLFAFPRLSRNNKVQWTGSFMVIFGVVLNRIDVGGLAMLGATGDSYTPLWTEIAISLGIISIAALVFLFAIEHFHVWDLRPEDPESNPHNLPSFDYTSHTWLGTPSTSNITKHTLAFVISFALGMALMPGKHLHSKGIDNIKVKPATGIDTLYINGNRDNQFVKFTHQAHIEWLRTHKVPQFRSDVFQNISGATNDSCGICHHLNLPGEKLSNCWECHTSMYAQVDFFNHDWHTSNTGANLKCNDCHQPGINRTDQSAKKCTSCHPAYKFTVNKKVSAKTYYTLSYTNAMHNLCVSCHLIESKKLKNKPHLVECSTCHKTQLPENLITGLKWKIKVPHYNNVILPDVKNVSSTNK